MRDRVGRRVELEVELGHRRVGHRALPRHRLQRLAVLGAEISAIRIDSGSWKTWMCSRWFSVGVAGVSPRFQYASASFHSSGLGTASPPGPARRPPGRSPRRSRPAGPAVAKNAASESIRSRHPPPPPTLSFSCTPNISSRLSIGSSPSPVQIVCERMGPGHMEVPRDVDQQRMGPPVRGASREPPVRGRADQAGQLGRPGTAAPSRQLRLVVTRVDHRLQRHRPIQPDLPSMLDRHRPPG